MFNKIKQRTFTVIGAFNHNGCSTKIRKNTTYTGTPMSAAKKAFTELCRVKSIRGVCTLYVVIREKTAGSKKKIYSYFLKRSKLKNPIKRLEGTKNEYSIMFSNSIKSKMVPSFSKCTNHKQSKGRMKKKTSMHRGGGNEGCFYDGSPTYSQFKLYSLWLPST